MTAAQSGMFRWCLRRLLQRRLEAQVTCALVTPLRRHRLQGHMELAAAQAMKRNNNDTVDTRLETHS